MTSKKEARYFSDKATFENPDFLSYCNKNFGGYPKELSKEGLAYRRVLQKNYQRWIKENKIKVVEGEKEPNEKKINSFLKEDRQKYVSLGCGFHKGVYYFGTKLFREGKTYTAIITSDKKSFLKLENNEIRNNFGLNYKDDFFDEGLDNIFSREAIDNWINKSSKDITLKSVYEKLIKLFKKYIYFEDKRNYSLLACYRIAGFFMPVWRGRARLFLWAEIGTSKSRLTQIMHNTGFNSVSLGDWTLPYLQRLIESTRGETHIDDFETLDEDKKISTIRLVKTGYMKGFKAGKISEGRTKRPETYDLFNTTTLNNTTGLDFISADRCITIRIPKIAKKEYDEEPKFEDSIWKELRDDLYILGLKYPKQISEVYDKISSEKIRGRLFFIIKPELTIAKFISNKIYEELEEFWFEEIEQRETIDYESNWEFLGFKEIYKLLSTLSTNTTLSTQSTLSTTNNYFNLKDIVIPIGKELYDDDEFKKKKRSMSITIGNSLSRNPIFKKRAVAGIKQYKVNFEEFKLLLEAKGFLNQILDILGLNKKKLVDRVDSVVGKTCINKEINTGILKKSARPKKIIKLQEMIKKLKKDKTDPEIIKIYEKELEKCKLK